MSAELMLVSSPYEFQRPILSRFLVIDGAVPSELAAGILGGKLLPRRVDHAYEPDGGRLTTKNHVGYERRIPGRLLLLDDDTSTPHGISAETDRMKRIGRSTFDQRYPLTEGRRIGLTEHLVFPAETDLIYPIMIDVYRNDNDVEGQVTGAAKIAGYMIAVARFRTIAAAEDFNAKDNPTRPPWLGENVTDAFSTRKLVEPRTRESTIDLLRKSANLDDLRIRTEQ